MQEATTDTLVTVNNGTCNDGSMLALSALKGMTTNRG